MLVRQLGTLSHLARGASFLRVAPDHREPRCAAHVFHQRPLDIETPWFELS